MRPTNARFKHPTTPNRNFLFPADALHSLGLCMAADARYNDVRFLRHNLRQRCRVRIDRLNRLHTGRH